MQFFKLRDNVYIVEGACSHAIYDFNNHKLYSINNFTNSLIRKIISSNIDKNFLSDEDKACLDFLLKNSIVEPTPTIYEEKKIEGQYSNNSLKFAWIEVTNLCNLRCIHCYSDKNTPTLGSMTLGDFSSVIYELKTAGVERIQIIGGEPLLLNKTLKKMFAMALPVFDQVSVYTNATLINREWANFFSKNRIKVNTTVYSYSAEEHDRVTQNPGSHELVNKGIQSLKNARVEYLVSCVKMKGIKIGCKNIDLYDLSDRYDVVRICGRAKLNLLNYELLKKKIITKKYFSRPLRNDLSSLLVSGHNCFSEKIYISHNLKVYPCVMERGFNYGSLKNHSLNDVICNADKITKNSIKVCRDCEYRYACLDCRPDRITKDIYAKPWYCTYDPYNAYWLPVDEFIYSLDQNINKRSMQ